MSLLTVLLIVLYHLRNHLLHGTIDNVVGNGIDGGVLIVVDRDDDTSVLHTGDVLNLSADTASDVELGVYGDTGLTNLAVMVGIACIHSGTAGTHFSVELLSQVKQ